MALLGDTVVTLVAPLAATMSIFGAQPAAGPVGYSDARRRLDFRPEATNSPSTDGTRRSGGMYMSAQLALRNLDLIIPDAPAGVLGACFVGANCSAITATNCTINGTTASNSARLLAGSDASALQFWFSGTIGPGATGRIFTGITPGQDPNLSKTYITNLTAA